MAATASTKPSRDRLRIAGNLAVSTVALAALSLAGAILLADLPRELTGGLVLLLVILLVFSGLSVGLSMIVAGALGLMAMTRPSAVAGTIEEVLFGAVASWPLSVIPVFILMGIMMWATGLTTNAYQTARTWFGGIPGGLAIGTNFAGAGLAAASGSTVGITYALGRIGIPEMLKQHYQPALATGVVAVAGTLGQIIPPSVFLVIYAGAAETSVGPQLLAGVLPGILLALAYAAMIWVRGKIKPSLAPPVAMTGITWATRFRSLGSALPIAIIIVVVLGGMFSGVFTPTEAGAVGAAGSIIVGWFSSERAERRLGQYSRTLWTNIGQTVVATAAIFLLLMGVEVLKRVIALSQIAQNLTETVVSLELGRIEFLLTMMVVYIIMGMFLDSLALVLLTVPVVAPILPIVGIDPIWFGVFTVLMAEIAVVTPPLGILVFIVHRMAQNEQINLGVSIKLADVFKGAAWFVGIAIVVILALIYVPDLVMWLPNSSLE